jgi:transposase-like protein
VNVAVVVASGVNAAGHREILGVELITTGQPSSGA